MKEKHLNIELVFLVSSLSKRVRFEAEEIIGPLKRLKRRSITLHPRTLPFATSPLVSPLYKMKLLKLLPCCRNDPKPEREPQINELQQQQLNTSVHTQHEAVSPAMLPSAPRTPFSKQKPVRITDYVLPKHQQLIVEHLDRALQPIFALYFELLNASNQKLFLQKFAAAHNVQYEEDDTHNVLIQVPATDYIFEPLCLQASYYNRVDPKIHIEQDLAGNLNGINGHFRTLLPTAMLLHLIEGDYNHGPLELLFTYQKSGQQNLYQYVSQAQYLSLPLLSKKLISITGTKSNEINIGALHVLELSGERTFKLQQIVPTHKYFGIEIVIKAQNGKSLRQAVQILHLMKTHRKLKIIRIQCLTGVFKAKFLIRKIKEESQADFQLRLMSYYNEHFQNQGLMQMLEFDCKTVGYAINKIDTVEIIDFFHNIVEGDLKFTNKDQLSLHTELVKIQQIDNMIKFDSKSTSLVEYDLNEHYNYVTDLCVINEFDVTKIQQYPGYQQDEKNEFIESLLSTYRHDISETVQLKFDAGQEVPQICKLLPTLNSVKIGNQITGDDNQEILVLQSVIILFRFLLSVTQTL